ncbi:MAG: hypothetical protein F4Z69_05995 [Bacteroidetes bacterium SB0668_bin_1]|nr:hypothetical protein [Bacteroidetes bacterium SB0668_bin_1]
MTAANWIMDDYRLHLWAESDDPALSLAAQYGRILRRGRESKDPDYPDVMRSDAPGILCRSFAHAWETPAKERSALAAVYEDRPKAPDRRRDPILPAIRWEGEAQEREAGRRLFGLIPDPPPHVRPGLLPLFPETPEALIRRVPLLSLADASGTPVMALGRGAPIDLRLAVEAFLSVSYEARSRESVRVAFTMRDLRDGLFPRGWTRRGPSATRPDDWHRLRAAILRTRDRVIPLPDGATWFPLAPRLIPGPLVNLDTVVVMDVALPPGAGDGPIIDRPALRLLGVDSGPRYRAFLAIEAANWIKGRTRVRTPKAASSFGWSGDRTRYPVFTAQDRKELAFGTMDRKNRTRNEIDGAFEGLPGTAILGKSETDARTGAVGWRIVPEDAAEAIRRAETVNA